MDGLTIKVWPSQSENGYMYEIFDSEAPDEDEECMDGGLCEGSFMDALEMASEHAKEILAKR